jgi:colicin import membrane protein
MDTAADRLEFAPPEQPGLMRSFVLAVAAHIMLVLALMNGLHWTREAQDAAVEAELWSAVPQQAAPKPVPTPPAPPPQPPQPAQPVVKPPPEPPRKSEADIALEREKEKRALEQQQRREELERQRAERAKIEAQKKHEEELARRKQEQAKQLEAKRKAEEEKERKLAEEKERKAKQQQQAALEDRKRQQLREDTLKRMQALAVGTGAPNATGNAARSAGPSGSWAGKVQARVRPNIVLTDDVPGNPEATVRVRLGPGGMIVGKPLLVKSSGSKAWDEAVVRALERTESLPPDTDGRYPSPVDIAFKPKA